MAIFRIITLLWTALALTGCLSLDNQIFGDETPEVIEKEVVVVAAPDGVTLEGKLYPYGTALEVLSQDDGHFSTVGWEWNTVDVPKVSLDSGEFRYDKVAWDRANNRLSFRDPLGSSWLRRYFHWTQMHLARAWPFALALALISAYLFVAGLGAGDAQNSGLTMFWPVLGMLFPLLFIGSCQGNNYYGLYDWGSGQAKLNTASGHLYPVPSGALSVTHTISYDLGLLLWIPAFVLLHLILIALVPLFVRGLVQAYYRSAILKRKGIVMSDEKKRMEVLSMAPIDVAVNTSWKSRILRLFGISECEERDQQVRLYQSATEVIKAEIEYHRTKSVRDRLSVSLAIDTLQELNRLIEEYINFEQLSARHEEKKERARRRKEATAERLGSRATEKSKLQLQEELAGFFIDTKNAELIAEVISALKRDAGADEEVWERVRRIEEAIEGSRGA